MITPIEITNRVFGRSIRGYNEMEVDSFLDQIARDYETLYRKQLELEEELQQKDKLISQYKNMEETMNNALVLAQKTSEEVALLARREAEVLIRDARGQAEEIIRTAVQNREQMALEETKLLQSFKGMKAQIKAFIMAQLELMESFSPEESEAAAAMEKRETEQV
ncbi:MAG: DivIVA domain-containing protein [Firmicutes bacterium]|nr:DivIVA domain-containing protein [Bacillota bacterium]